MISAKTARELAQLPSFIKRLEKRICIAAKLGNPSLFCKGQLNWEIHKKLRDELGYEVSYDIPNVRTLIWWGN